MKYFGFAVADGMFPEGCLIGRRTLTVDEVKAAVAQGVESCCNPSHKATIDAMRSRFGIDVSIPDAPPCVALGAGDSAIVMGVRGLPRLTDRHEYTAEEIKEAEFAFGLWTVYPKGSVPFIYESEFGGYTIERTAKGDEFQHLWTSF